MIKSAIDVNQPVPPSYMYHNYYINWIHFKGKMSQNLFQSTNLGLSLHAFVKEQTLRGHTCNYN